MIFARLVKNVRLVKKRSNCFGIPTYPAQTMPHAITAAALSLCALPELATSKTHRSGNSVFESGIEIPFVFGKASGDASPCD